MTDTLSTSSRANLEPLKARTLFDAGDLDAAFGAGGHVALAFPGAPFDARAVALRADGNTMPDSNYTARAIAAGVTNAAGQPMTADHVLEFFVLAGDADRDRRVNLADFNIIAGNFGQSNRTFSQGDFNYDGSVTLQDFNILAARFGKTVAPAGTGWAGNDDDLRDLLYELT